MKLPIMPVKFLVFAVQKNPLYFAKMLLYFAVLLIINKSYSPSFHSVTAVKLLHVMRLLYSSGGCRGVAIVSAETPSERARALIMQRRLVLRRAKSP